MHAGIMSRKPWITQLSFLFLQSLEGWRLACPLLPDVSREGWGGGYPLNYQCLIVERALGPSMQEGLRKGSNLEEIRLLREGAGVGPLAHA